MIVGRNSRIADAAVTQRRRRLAFVTSTADACHFLPLCRRDRYSGRQMATIDTHRAAEAPVSRSPTSLMSPLLNSFSHRVLG
jgi:hypothetical protein